MSVLVEALALVIPHRSRPGPSHQAMCDVHFPVIARVAKGSHSAVAALADAREQREAEARADAWRGEPND